MENRQRISGGSSFFRNYLYKRVYYPSGERLGVIETVEGINPDSGELYHFEPNPSARIGIRMTNPPDYLLTPRRFLETYQDGFKYTGE
jgi:hypothetical protein